MNSNDIYIYILLRTYVGTYAPMPACTCMYYINTRNYTYASLHT